MYKYVLILFRVPPKAYPASQPSIQPAGQWSSMPSTSNEEYAFCFQTFAPIHHLYSPFAPKTMRWCCGGRKASQSLDYILCWCTHKPIWSSFKIPLPMSWSHLRLQPWPTKYARPSERYGTQWIARKCWSTFHIFRLRIVERRAPHDGCWLLVESLVSTFICGQSQRTHQDWFVASRCFWAMTEKGERDASASVFGRIYTIRPEGSTNERKRRKQNDSIYIRSPRTVTPHPHSLRTHPHPRNRYTHTHTHTTPKAVAHIHHPMGTSMHLVAHTNHSGCKAVGVTVVGVCAGVCLVDGGRFTRIRFARLAIRCAVVVAS